MKYTKVKPTRAVLDAIKAEILEGVEWNVTELSQAERLILELLDGKRDLSGSGRINALQQVTATN